MLNSPETLKKLRTTCRVRQPALADHPLIRAAKKTTKLKVYYFKRKPKNLDFGSAPTDALYENHTLYVGPDASKCLNGVWHEMCHAMVANLRKKRDSPNYGADETITKANDRDEVLSCKVEFYLGFVTGYYSYRYLMQKVVEYGFLQDMRLRQNPRLPLWKLPTPSSVRSFLLKCREQALKVPDAKKVARKLGVHSKQALLDQIETHAQ